MGPRFEELANPKKAWIKKSTHACKYCGEKFRNNMARVRHENSCPKKF